MTVVSHLAQPPETGLTEDVATGVHLEGFVEDVKTHGTDEILVDLGELRLGLQQLLTNHKSVLAHEQPMRGQYYDKSSY